MIKIFKACIVFVLILSLAGCASIVSGQSQFIPITTNPPGATVTIDGRSKVTPATFQLPKSRDAYSVKIEKEGYNTVETDLVRGLSGWLFGNICLGPVGIFLGVGIDLASGSAWKYKPMKIDETLSPIQTPVQSGKK